MVTGHRRARAEADAAAEVVALRRQVETLDAALLSSRLIGAAVGLVMAEHQVSRMAAFAMLRSRSQNSNVRLAAVASDLVDQADRRAAG